MRRLRFEKTKKRDSKKSKGFYVALGVCLIAVGAAAWTTYDGVKNYMTPTQTQTESSSQPSSSRSEQQAGVNVSGVTAESSAPSSKEPSSAAASSSKAHPSSAPEVSSRVESTSSDKEALSGAVSQSSPGDHPINIYPSGQKVIKNFSGDNPVYSKTLNDWRVHNGVDLSAKKGSPVKAVSAGTVKDVYDDPMLGQTVVIQHDGFEAYYSGLEAGVPVHTGDSVNLGQQIGSVGDVPCETVDEIHLHFAIKQDGKWVDPLDFLSGSGNS